MALIRRLPVDVHTKGLDGTRVNTGCRYITEGLLEHLDRYRLGILTLWSAQNFRAMGSR